MDLIAHTIRVFTNHFGSSPRSVKELTKGVMNRKFIVDHARGKFCIRFYLVEGDKKVMYEPAIMEKARMAGAHVPWVVFTSVSEKEKAHPFIVYEWVSGEDMSSMPEMDGLQFERLVEDIVVNLELIASIKMERYGELNIECEGEYNGYATFIHQTIIEGTSHLQSLRQFSKLNIAALRKQLLSFVPFLPANMPAHLAWADVSFDNIIVSDGRLAAFIDFEHSLSGDTDMTLGYFYAKHCTSPFFSPLIELYARRQQKKNMEEVMQFYSLIRLLRFAKYLDDRLPNGDKRDDIFTIFPGIKASLQPFINP